MNRRELEQAIKEVGRRMHLDYFYIIGSAAVFASIPVTTDEALSGTRDVDVIPAPPAPSDVQSMADRIDFILGEGSDFDNENGYYIQGVDASTPSLAPKAWRERAVQLRAGGYTGLCMEVHDLAISKYGIGRQKDLDFTRALAKGGFVSKRTLLDRLGEVDADSTFLALMRARIESDFRGVPGG